MNKAFLLVLRTRPTLIDSVPPDANASGNCFLKGKAACLRTAFQSIVNCKWVCLLNQLH